MLIQLTLADGTLIGISPRFIAHIVPADKGTRITFADGSHKDVVEPFDRVMAAAASVKKDKGLAA